MVRAWREKVVIPTYETGKPEKNPVFLEKRVYQGSSGVVYPYPVIESIADEKTDHEYNAIYLENEYIKVMILPELGGRIQMAYDKIAQRHFIYYNQVVKPALVGLAGPWISGGIEFNWPQHHRPSTFMPVDSTIEDNKDGSVTVWCGERERMFHQKGMAGFTLRPGCAYLEIKGVLYNPTETPQTFLWWANPAVKVNDAYQSVFPPDVNAVFDHGKRAVSTFPIARGVYYKMDYSAGVDISNYKNIYVPTSYMVAKSNYDFEGGYENDTRCGMLHVANHRFSPGKKQWTWGNGDFGRAWDRNLTDEDGPYIELMAGVYTENQPDFSWLMPYEEKSFVQYFFPYRELGVVKNANKDLVLNILPAEDGSSRIMVYATSRQECGIRVEDRGGNVVFEEDTILSPEKVYDRIVPIGEARFQDLVLKVNDLSCEAVLEQDLDIPDPAEAALKPEEIDTCEQLYLTGLHLEQYRHATWCALDYYEEALRRDPSDVRNNNAVGLWYVRRGRFAKAEPYLRMAVKVLRKRNLNPYDGEPLYNLGLCLKYQGKLDEAYDWFYKSTWNAAWQDAGYFACAQISCQQGRWEDALDEVDHALYRNWHNHRARALKVAILRHLGRQDEARELALDSLSIDIFNHGCRFELIMLGSDVKDDFLRLMRDDTQNYDELALDYVNAGLHQEADKVWSSAEERGCADIMSYYYWGRYDKAAASDPAYAFPNRLEAIAALSGAPEDDAKAPYLLGNLFYDKRQYDLAVEAWEKSAALDPAFPTVWRNLALAYYNKLHDAEKALGAMERAFSLDRADARILMELDQLYKKIGKPARERLDNLRKYPELVAHRDDLILEEITLLNQTGQFEEAMKKLDAHLFHPWEGGEGKVPAQYQTARVELAKRAMENKQWTEAIRLLEECLVYPHNLGEGKLYGAQEQDFYYFLGCAHQGAGDLEQAHACWAKAAEGDLKPANALYYNDAKPEKIYYQGLALKALGRIEEAERKFRSLIDFGKAHIDEIVVMDYFAVSLPDLLVWDEDLNRRNRENCQYLIDLGNKGLAG
jgi:tetratricopeptide (TPR) repeat protein